MQMCKALQELENKGRVEGKFEGRLEGIQAVIRTCKKFNLTQEGIIKNLMEEFSLPEEQAAEYVKQYW